MPEFYIGDEFIFNPDDKLEKVELTQAEYAALTEKKDNVLYVITDAVDPLVEIEEKIEGVKKKIVYLEDTSESYSAVGSIVNEYYSKYQDNPAKTLAEINSKYTFINNISTTPVLRGGLCPVAQITSHMDMGEVIHDIDFAEDVNGSTARIRGLKLNTESLIAIYSIQGEDNIYNKVNKVTGKGLSTNDFTDAYKTKLDGLSSSTDVSEDQFRRLTIAKNSETTDSIDIDLRLDGKYISYAKLGSATTTEAGLMSSIDKTKLNGIIGNRAVNNIQITPSVVNLSYISVDWANNAWSSTNGTMEIPSATSTNAGVMAASDKSRLDGVTALFIPGDVSPTSNNVAIEYTTYDWQSGSWDESLSEFVIPAATTTTAGVMSASDKLAVDSFLTEIELVRDDIENAMYRIESCNDTVLLLSSSSIINPNSKVKWCKMTEDYTLNILNMRLGLELQIILDLTEATDSYTIMFPSSLFKSNVYGLQVTAGKVGEVRVIKTGSSKPIVIASLVVS